MAVIRREFALDGLCCPMCADKIEEGVAALEGVSSAIVNFASQRLAVELTERMDESTIMSRIRLIVRQEEPSIVVREMSGAKKALNKSESYRLLRMIIGSGFFVAGMFLKSYDRAHLAIFIVSYLLIGGDIVIRAMRNIVKGRIFDENFLMCVATAGAFAIGDFAEGVAVMLFYQVGETLQRFAVGRSRRSIASLLELRPDYANLAEGSEVRKVAPEEVHPGQRIVVRPGEKVPLDGVVLEGQSFLDTAALTGEPVPRQVVPGDEVLSGCINKNGLLTVEVTKEFGESTASKVLDLVQNASAQKSQTENFITKFARYYTPVVVFAAAVLAFLPPLVIPGAQLYDWVHRALVFLVVSCPCALVVSIPLSFFAGIGAASRYGILVKGSNYLDALALADTVVFDKTGTLTKGVFDVTEVVPRNINKEELLHYAAVTESGSNHPIAVSIRKAAANYGEKTASVTVEYSEFAGLGVRAVTEGGETILSGKSDFLTREGVKHPASESSGTVVYIAVDGIFVGHIVISDEIKPDSHGAIASLREAGVKKIVMLTGDSRPAGEEVARELGLDDVYAELLPHEKVETIEKIGGRQVFVGDGINDAPVLARADVGIAMGGAGADAAIEAADVVLMTDEPSKVAKAVSVAKKTRRIVLQNIILALGIKAAILVLGAFGVATMWEAVFGDVGVTLLAVLNALRVNNS